MFAGTAIVGTLGGAFGVSGLGPLQGTGKNVFAAALVCVALALAAAVVARVPYRMVVNRWSLESLEEGFEKMVTFRFRALVTAGGLFALAIILAGLAPLFS